MQGELTPETKAWIDSASLETLLEKWRFAPAGSPLFCGETGEYYKEVMNRKREADPGGWTAASKSIGW
jgi:hypothetical protein